MPPLLIALDLTHTRQREPNDLRLEAGYFHDEYGCTSEPAYYGIGIFGLPLTFLPTRLTLSVLPRYGNLPG